MSLSTYQLERFLDRLRRFRGWLAHPGESRLTRPRVDRVREDKTYPPQVENERERRAGSFMNPPYPHPPNSPRIPKLRRDKN